VLRHPVASRYGFLLALLVGCGRAHSSHDSSDDSHAVSALALRDSVLVGSQVTAGPDVPVSASAEARGLANSSRSIDAGASGGTSPRSAKLKDKGLGAVCSGADSRGNCGPGLVCCVTGFQGHCGGANMPDMTYPACVLTSTCIRPPCLPMSMPP
jgi:hypothetical protein